SLCKHVWYLFFFSSRRRHTRFSRDWSSDVCSSDLATDQAAHDAVDVQLGGRDRERGVAGVVGPQAVPRGPVTGARRAPLQVLERGLVLADPDGADLAGALRLDPLEQHDVAVLDAVGHGVAPDAQGEVVGAAPEDQVALGLRVGADGQAGGDLAEERDAHREAEQPQARGAAGAAALEDELALGLEGLEVLAQGGV